MFHPVESAVIWAGRWLNSLQRVGTATGTPAVCRMKRWRQCYPDEHYMPSLLAREGLDNATDCHGGIMSVDWTTKDWHPVTYTAANVSTEL